MAASRQIRLDRNGIPPAESAYRVGIVHLAEDRLEEGIGWLRRAAALDPGHAKALYTLGVAMEALGNPVAALRFYRSSELSQTGHRGARRARLALERQLGSVPTPCLAPAASTSSTSRTTSH